MGGGPLYVVISLTAFVVGFVPGVLTTWLAMRLELPRAEWWSLFKVVATARSVTAGLAGVVLPLLISMGGLLASYFWSNGNGYAGFLLPAVLGGWVMSVEPHWLRTLALVTAWGSYFATLGFTLALELWLVRRLEPRFANAELVDAARRGIRAAYAVQALIVLVVLWELHWR
jgi:hypothetical protein